MKPPVVTKPPHMRALEPMSEVQVLVLVLMWQVLELAEESGARHWQATANTLRASRANALSVPVCVMVLSGERCVWCGLSVV